MRKPAFKTFLFLATVTFTGALDAAGLGRLTLNSTLGQPFRAEIDLVAVKMEERPFLAARLASRDTFRLANVDYSPSLSAFKTSVETRADGQSYIKVVSTQPVVEPLLNMLIELNWPSGRVLREYAVLLPMAEADASDPSAWRSSSSSSDRAPSTPATVSGPVHVDKTERFSGKQLPEKAGEKRAQKGAADPALPVKGNTVYGPVKQGDTLGEIVKHIALPAGISFNQMLIALQRANSDAFLGNNIHQLKAGPILRIPDASEIKAIPRMEADKEVDTQTMEWNRGRSPDAARVPTGELRQTVSGKIAAADSDPGTAAPPRHILRLSRGEELPGNGGNGTATHTASLAEPMAGGQNKLRMEEEDAIARDGSLLDANERIALLEKNITELQRLLELRRQALAELQKQPHDLADLAKNVPDTGEGSSTPAVAAATGEAPHTIAAAQPQFPSSTLISVAGASVGEGTGGADPGSAMDSSLVEIAGSVQGLGLPRNKPETAHPGQSGSLIEDLMRNIEYLGGALILLITGVVGVSISRRPRQITFADIDTGRAGGLSGFPVEDKAPLMQSDGKQSAGQSAMVPGAMDSVAGKAPDNSGAGSRKADRKQYAAPGIPESNSSRSFHATHSSALSQVPVASFSSPVPVYPTMKEGHPGLFEAHRSGSPAWYRQGKDTPWHEIANKIDLARAYQEMGDSDAAGQVLQEVMREGDMQQQARARALLSNL
ncbi:MAG TPA: FimV/HubP family polar landmark protein [Nitrosospira sp.]|nr:FimV/HubP family polar landmark protein [Nitrosospira sp.]